MPALEGLLPIIIFIIIASLVSGRSKKIKVNRPGQGGAKPAPGDSTVRRPYAPAQPTVKPSYAPEQPAAEAAAPSSPADGYSGGILDETDRARTDLDEGDSRECDHGSVGGSMDITSHAGMGEEFEHARPQAKPNVKPAYAAAADSAPLQSAAKLTAAQMRQAVVWAEILRRPSERWQGGRWTAR